MDEILATVTEALESGERLALVTLVRSFGSTPRHKSARLAVFGDGRFVGSIGGGTMELQAIADAKAALSEGKPRLVEYNLIGRGEGNVGLCGGTQEVFIDTLSAAANDAMVAQLSAMGEALRAGEPVVLATIIRAERGNNLRSGAKLVVRMAGDTVGSLGDARLERIVIDEAKRILSERYPQRIGIDPPTGAIKRLTATRRAPVEILLDVFEPEPRLLIIGAGHIGAALAKAAKFLGWWVIVVDDRPSFATRENLPDADEIHLVDYTAATEKLGPLNVHVTTDTAVVVSTWGWDEPALRQLAGVPAFYIGLVASVRKAMVIFDTLRAEGIDPDWLKRVRVPVGLDLGAEKPEEIALAIIAEVLAVARGKSGKPLREVRGDPLAASLDRPETAVAPAAAH